LFDRAPLAAWNAGPVALLGDAAHPVLPFLAQGAAQAIEDAAALAVALSRQGPIAARLAAYSLARQARALRVQEAARSLGRVYHLAGPAALARDIAMRALGPTRLLARYDWLYATEKTMPRDG
jgi:salicylate hydroxylase